MLPALLGALVAGLLATPHCAAMCGGFAAACAAHHGGTGALALRLRSAQAWHLGRLAGYALLGAVAGAFGRAIPGPAWLPAALATLLLAWSAASLAGLTGDPGAAMPALVRRVATTASALARRPGAPARAAFGFAVAFLPCGMLWAALGASVASGGALPGALLMLAFGAGTLPGLVAVGAGLRRVAGASLARRRLLAAGVLAAGLVVIGMRWSAGREGMAPHAHSGMHGR